MENKIKLLALYFTNIRSVDLPELEKLRELEGIYAYVYELNRYEGNDKANLLALEVVIKKVLSDN